MEKKTGISIAFRVCVETLVTNIPEMTVIQQMGAAQASPPQGELPSGVSQFSSLMNQELNNNTV